MLSVRFPARAEHPRPRAPAPHTHRSIRAPWHTSSPLPSMGDAISSVVRPPVHDLGRGSCAQRRQAGAGSGRWCATLKKTRESRRGRRMRADRGPPFTHQQPHKRSEQPDGQHVRQKRGEQVARGEGRGESGLGDPHGRPVRCVLWLGCCGSRDTLLRARPRAAVSRGWRPRLEGVCPGPTAA
jgi:hypothetical protein